MKSKLRLVLGWGVRGPMVRTVAVFGGEPVTWLSELFSDVGFVLGCGSLPPTVYCELLTLRTMKRYSLSREQVESVLGGHGK